MKPITNNSAPTTQPFLMLNNSDGCFRVLLSDIVYCKSYNSSTEFRISGNRKLVVSKPIIYYEHVLFNFGFLRIHHNSIVNIRYMCHTCKGEESNELTLTTGEKLTISRARKNEVFQTIKQWSVEADCEQANKPFNGLNHPLNLKNPPPSNKSSGH